MKIHYYLLLFPSEALVASQLEPAEFGAYMAVGVHRGSAEKLIFIELTEPFENSFDWEYASQSCVAHEDGRPKHSLYLGVYRVLEQVPVEAMGRIHLTTHDGRTLSLEAQPLAEQAAAQDYWVYQELCPIHPLVVSKLAPPDFIQTITDPTAKIRVPKIAFAVLKPLPDPEAEDTGNLGPLYDGNLSHIQYCIETLGIKGKKSKTINRSHIESFSFQVVGDGFYVGNRGQIKFYPMPTHKFLHDHHYDWACSAQIL